MRLIKLLKKYFRNITLSINIICSAFLLFSYLSVYISPARFSVFAFLGLIYSILLFVNIVFIFFWIFSKSKFFLISLISILIGWNFLSHFIQLSFNKNEIDSQAQSIQVLSYNVRVFDLWNWSSEKNRARHTFRYIRKSKANIVCLQEFYSSNVKGKNARDSILNNSVLKYAHISYTIKNNKTYNHGIATFSSYPIVAKGNLKLQDGDNFCIYSDIQIGQDTIRVYNLHLESIHLGYDDYQLIENINSTDTIDVNGLKNIFLKLNRGFKKRARQSALISSHIEKCQYPVLLCGDFNDTPVSYVYKLLTEKLMDSFCESGNGIGSTYINRYSTFRIDYILHSSEFNSFNFITPHVELSDHYPVKCLIQLNRK
jgi:endonuclease/exonuclease/phosphatase family metal-dependent hydrolase